MSEYGRARTSKVWRMGWFGLVVGLAGCTDPQRTTEVPASGTSTGEVAAGPSASSKAPPDSTATAVPSNGLSQPPADATATTCATDADCVVTNFAGCCACPQCSKAAPRALTRAALAAEEAKCQVVRCNTAMCDTAGMCPPGEDAAKFVGRCRANACALERK